MFNDVCVEYMVKKKNTALDVLKQSLVVVLGLSVSTLIINFVLFNESPMISSLAPFAFLASIGVLYLTYTLMKNMNVEYEYILTNGDMDIDKIMAKNTRKRVVSVKCPEFEAFGKYDKNVENNKNFQTKFTVCDSLESDNLYYFISRSAKYGRVFVIFNADDKVLTAMKPFLPKEFRV